MVKVSSIAKCKINRLAKANARCHIQQPPPGPVLISSVGQHQFSIQTYTATTQRSYISNLREIAQTRKY